MKAFIFRHISLYTFGTSDVECRCLDKDSRPSDHILNESESFGKPDMIADFIEISKHNIFRSSYVGESISINQAKLC